MNSPSNPPSSNVPLSATQRVGIICDVFDSAWQAGHRPVVELFIGRVVGPERGQLLRELIALEIEHRTRRGETPDVEEYRQRFAGFEAELATLFANSDTPVLTPETVDLPSIDVTVKSIAGLTGDTPFDSQRVQKDEKTPKQNATPFVKDDQREVQQFGDYAIVAEIARGGMGVVYKAWQKSLNRLVALKMITRGEFADAEEISRFQIEAESAARLDHPGIVPVYEVGERDGRHYFSMGLVEGGNLSSLVTGQSLSHKEVAQLVLKITDAIAYAHSKGVIHRDLKPGNVLIDENNDPRITDFGLAKQIEDGSNLTVTGQIIGTPSYMPPEQAAGQTSEIVETADVYSIGAILYALLCGRPPFQSPNVLNTLVQVMEQEPVPPRQFNSKIPVDLETICLKCLEKSRQRRYLSATELAEELSLFIAGHPISARPISSLSRFKRWCQRNPLIAGLSTAFVLSLIAGLGVSIYFAILAEGRAAAAQQGATIAMNTLDKVIYKVHKDLEKIPNARTIRRDLLKQALEDLNQIPAEFLQQTKLDRDSATVMRNLGQIVTELGDEAGSTTKTAISYFQRSVDILEELYANHPQDEAIKNDLALSNELLGDFYLDLPRPKQAEPLLKRNLELMNQLVAEHPDNSGYRFGLSYAHTIWGDLYSIQRQFRQAIESHNKAVDLMEELLQTDPDNTKYQDMYANNLEKTGDSQFDLGDLPSAKETYQKSYALSKKLYDANPQNLRLQYSFSSSCERMGNLYLQLGELNLSRQMYEQEVEIAQQTVADDPTNLERKSDLLIALDKLIRVQTLLKDFKAAEETTKIHIETRRQMHKQNPGNISEAQFLRGSEARLNQIQRMREQNSEEPNTDEP